MLGRGGRGRVPLFFALVLGASAGALLGGCGSSTRTVSVSGAPAPSSAASASRSTTAAPSTDSTASATVTSSTTATRTATEPAFTHGGTGTGGAAAAAAVLRAHGYTPNDTSQYHPDQTLRVLVGTRSGSADGYSQQAFFFVGDRYIGTDASQPSAGIAVAGQSDTEVTLTYPLYRPHDALCCPGGGHATVHFQLNNGKLVPLEQIPPASSQTGLSRQ